MRRFIAIGIVIFLVIVSLIWVFARRGDRPQQDVSVKKESALVDYANSSTVVRFSQAGEINARENHRVLEITVGQNQRVAVIYDGYQGNILKSENFLNDPDAYRAFLAALENSGFTRSRVATRNVNPLGACPTGFRYSYDIIDGADTKQALWSTSCGNIRGTFAGQAPTTRSLFQAQLPNYDEFVKGVQF